jgi:hypothetical protein
MGTLVSTLEDVTICGRGRALASFDIVGRMDRNYKVGDKVWLVSGGPEMTVAGYPLKIHWRELPALVRGLRKATITFARAYSTGQFHSITEDCIEPSRPLCRSRPSR